MALCAERPAGLPDDGCRICRRPAVARCSRCRLATYCGPGCQEADWRTHNAICSRAPCPERPRQELPDGSSAKPVFAPVGPTVGTPGRPADFDVILTGERSVENAQRVVDVLKERGVCVVKAGADKAFQRALSIEAKLLWDAGEFCEAKKGQPVVPGSSQIRFDSRDDKVVWMSSEWTKKNERRCKALKVLDGQLGDFGMGLSQLLEDQLGLSIRRRTCGMLSCYAGDSAPGARYDFHVDNPYQTSMEVPDDKRRLTLVFYISDGPWDVDKDGGAFQACLAGPRKAPRTMAEAVRSEKLTVAPDCDTMVVFFAHTMYHAVLPLRSNRRRFALSTWFQCP